jgi:hypothetical protein
MSRFPLFVHSLLLFPFIFRTTHSLPRALADFRDTRGNVKRATPYSVVMVDGGSDAQPPIPLLQVETIVTTHIISSLATQTIVHMVEPVVTKTVIAVVDVDDEWKQDMTSSFSPSSTSSSSSSSSSYSSTSSYSSSCSSSSNSSSSTFYTPSVTGWSNSTITTSSSGSLPCLSTSSATTTSWSYDIPGANGVSSSTTTTTSSAHSSSSAAAPHPDYYDAPYRALKIDDWNATLPNAAA